MPRRSTANLTTGGQLFRGRFDHLVNIATGRERPRTRAGQNNHADLIVALELFQLFVDLAAHFVAERISLFRSIRIDQGDLLWTPRQKVLVAHRRVSPRGTNCGYLVPRITTEKRCRRNLNDEFAVLMKPQCWLLVRIMTLARTGHHAGVRDGDIRSLSRQLLPIARD